MNLRHAPGLKRRSAEADAPPHVAAVRQNHGNAPVGGHAELPARPCAKHVLAGFHAPCRRVHVEAGDVSPPAQIDGDDVAVVRDCDAAQVRVHLGQRLLGVEVLEGPDLLDEVADRHGVDATRSGQVQRAIVR